MAKIELDLLENATDSLNEALTKYTEGKNGNLKAFKFAILHFSHFFELLLKYYVSESHPLLIYKNPFSKKIEKENTIGIWDAVQFLKNEGHGVSKQFEDDLRWFKELRNDIEHHKFSLDVEEAKSTLGRLMQTINEFNETVASFELKDHVDKELISEFEILADEYKAKVAQAIEDAEKIGGVENGYYCSCCGIAGTMSLTDGVYKCHFCNEECDEVECSVCGINIPEYEGQIWNDDHPPHVDYICDSCVYRIAHM
ncbi:hypothetical protein [Teredinibacter sp. KSP-S5-2]|uniref:hypothetical protein n=1 Tax=Teredinibacter sp. KSP-S5-2 TaxID=3034506 RepID=UPI0029352BDC|nr:hypothetical protein [Teredinibacter sp. KSP-S5-2]WNO10499.1 hypothetical protein P5V12_04870 [Teredinibacter sp. KSP-S5-2]